MSLEKYKEKRRFNKTPEPRGGKSSSSQLLFVIQKHQASHLHYDFRLEIREVLKSWAVPKGPSLNPSQKRLAQLVEDHPFDYKDFEGIIPEGNYGAGTVIIWDQGNYEPINSTGDKEQDEKLLLKQFFGGAMKIVLHGKKLKGEFTLVKTPDRGHNAWLLSKLKDKYAKEDIEITHRDMSVVSGLTIEEMEENSGATVWHSNRSASATAKSKTRTKRKPADSIVIPAPEKKKAYKSIIEFIKREFKGARTTKIPNDLSPMLATRTNAPFDNADWLFEIKWDGFRCLAYVNNGKALLRSRSNLSYNKTFEPIVESLQKWPVNAILDGEVVVLNEQGKPDFEALQNFGNRTDQNLVYYVFDLLWLEGFNLMNTPLEKRKEMLQKILPQDARIRFSDSIEEVGVDFFEVAKQNELEGIVAKKKNSIYVPGKRTNDWLKIPTEVRQEFVIGGYTESGSGRPFRSLLFGYYEGGKLINVGHSGGGFNEKQMKEIYSRLKELETKKNPFANEVEADTKTHWVKPQLVAEIKYASLTSSKKIRKPAIFLGFREDKDPKEVVKEIDVLPNSNELDEKKTPLPKKKVESPSDSNWPVILNQKIQNRSVFTFENKEVELTNIDRKLWGDFTKADLLMYYHSVCDFIIPHLKDRPLSLHIKHIAPTEKGLYIKDMEGHQPDWAEIYSVDRKHKKKGKRDVIDYLVCNDEATLQYIINLGCIDINPWTSRTVSPDHPDFVIIDLDPSDEDFSKAIEAAKAAKQFFDKHKIKSFVKTSGKTGIHLYLPCNGFTFPEARQIAENICTEINILVPDITTTEISVNSRGDKLYLDPNQNDFADTVAAPYSMRPYKLPTISTPLEWKEVNSKLHPENFTIKAVLNLLKRRGDIWQNLIDRKIIKSNTRALNAFS
jgi:bifunctional non-homologous end joining protein LigD